MRTDLYTKCILTVIATALIALFFKKETVVSTAAAATNFNKFASVPVNQDGSINVRLVSDMDVNIRSVGGSSVSGSIPINLKEIGGSSFYGALPVNLKEVSGSSLGSSGLPVNIEAVDGTSIYSAVPVKESK
ncbi:MAG: hypothetical protein ACJ77K_08555 [Bacteroidia bacterium]